MGLIIWVALLVALEALMVMLLWASVRRTFRDAIYMLLLAIEFWPLLFVLSPGSPLAATLPSVVSDGIVVVCAILLLLTVAAFILRHPSRGSHM